MALNALETAKELISYAVVTDKNGLVKLLERNGIELPNNPSDNEVTVAVLMANQKSGVFRNELKKYLVGLVPDVANYTTELGGNMNFTGTDDFSFTAGDDEFFNATDFMAKIKEENHTLSHYPITTYWLDIGMHKDYEQAQKNIHHIDFD